MNTINELERYIPNYSQKKKAAEMVFEGIIEHLDKKGWLDKVTIDRENLTISSPYFLTNTFVVLNYSVYPEINTLAITAISDEYMIDNERTLRKLNEINGKSVQGYFYLNDSGNVCLHKDLDYLETDRWNETRFERNVKTVVNIMDSYLEQLIEEKYIIGGTDGLLPTLLS